MQKKTDSYPMLLFVIYILFYSGQAIYNTYLNLYLANMGMTGTQIGATISISTFVLLFAQTLLGIASDRVKYKNTILMILYAVSAIVCLQFYFSSNILYLMIVVTLFVAFYSPIMTLMDNYLLESLENSRWDYGQIRIGGTLGYCITVLVIGFIIHNDYKQIFWMVSLSLLGCLFLTNRLPKVRGFQKDNQRTRISVLLKNKALIAIIGIHIVFQMGICVYYSFYSIYFTKVLGADSRYVGIMMFASALAEIPFLLIMRKLVRRIGIQGTLFLAGMITAVRWFLLFFLTNPVLIIFANLLHGIGFAGFSYCTVTYINKAVPQDLRASSQTLNSVISGVIIRIIFGYAGGYASEVIGTNNIMLICAGLMAAATIGFSLWAHFNENLFKANT